MLIKRERLKVHVSPQAEMGIWDELRQHFHAYIHDVKSQYWKDLHLSFVESGEAVPAEIYFADPDVVLYYTVDTRREFIEAGCLLQHGDGMQAFQGFCERIKDAILPGYKDREPLWKPYDEVNGSFDMIREEAQRVGVSPEKLESAAALADDGRRKILRSIFNQRSCLLENLTNGRSLMEVGQEVQLLESLGLVQKDFVVFCKESGNQITRVNSFTQIEEATRRGFKCFSCGRPIAEERIDQLLACTPEGIQLARPNHWLGLTLSRGLEKLGIKASQQLTVVPPNQAVLQVFANYDGVLAMFEVKEDAVHLDDVFLFLSRIGYYRPDVAFYVTTHPVTAEVRKYLASPCPTPVMLLESPQDVDTRVSQVLTRMLRERVRGIIDRLEPLTHVEVGKLIYEHFFGKDERMPEEILESHESLTEAHQETGGAAPSSATPEGTAAAAAASAAAAEAAAVASGHEDTESMPLMEMPAAGEEMAHESVPQEPVPIMVESTELPTPDMGLAMAEEIVGLDTPMIGMEEVFELSPDMPSSDKSVDEEHELTLRRAVDDVNTHGVIGRERALQAHLSEINTTPGMTSAFATDNGLLLAGALDDEQDGDLVAALTAEVWDSVRRGLEELGARPARRVQVDSAGDRLQIRPAAERVLLVVREARPTRESEEEMAASLPGEMVLREAMLKKVLEDLSMVEGMRGNIVAGRDGLLIDALLETEDVPQDVLSAVFSQIMVESEKCFLKWQLIPLRQMSVKTPDALYSLIPLDREGILISLLDPTTPREVWQNRLFAAANMLTSVFQ